MFPDPIHVSSTARGYGSAYRSIIYTPYIVVRNYLTNVRANEALELANLQDKVSHRLWPGKFSTREPKSEISLLSILGRPGDPKLARFPRPVRQPIKHNTRVHEPTWLYTAKREQKFRSLEIYVTWTVVSRTINNLVEDLRAFSKEPCINSSTTTTSTRYGLQFPRTDNYKYRSPFPGG